MPNESQAKLPKWARWVEIIRVTPSGKTMFVCLVCGRSTPSPDKTCPAVPYPDEGKHRFQHFVEVEFPEVGTCQEIERIINRKIASRREDQLVLDYTENRLREWMERYCENCRGYGCQVCFGAGHDWK